MAVSIKIHGFLDAFANVTLTTNLLNFLKMHLGGNRIAVLQNSIKIMRSKKGGKKKKKKCFATFAERKKNRICIGTLFPK